MIMEKASLADGNDAEEKREGVCSRSELFTVLTGCRDLMGAFPCIATAGFPFLLIGRQKTCTVVLGLGHGDRRR